MTQELTEEVVSATPSFCLQSKITCKGQLLKIVSLFQLILILWLHCLNPMDGCSFSFRMRDTHSLAEWFSTLTTRSLHLGSYHMCPCLCPNPGQFIIRYLWKGDPSIRIDLLPPGDSNVHQVKKQLAWPVVIVITLSYFPQ